MLCAYALPFYASAPARAPTISRIFSSVRPRGRSAIEPRRLLPWERGFRFSVVCFAGAGAAGVAGAAGAAGAAGVVTGAAGVVTGAAGVVDTVGTEEAGVAGAAGTAATGATGATADMAGMAGAGCIVDTMGMTGMAATGCCAGRATGVFWTGCIT